MINLNGLNEESLLHSEVPERVLMAILGNVPKEQRVETLRLVIERLRFLVPHKNKLSRYLSQLLIIARMRKLAKETIEIVNDMTLRVDVEKDYLYQQGIEKGLEKNQEKVILTGWKEGLSLKLLSTITGLSQKKVKAIIRKSYPDVSFS
ncbi:MAG TPA: hypothetical protein ENJ45_06235 [Phaeodactylibacter sp.]|nr:hypothetical protein [Phaeodactylibacter sp.]